MFLCTLTSRNSKSVFLHKNLTRKNTKISGSSQIYNECWKNCLHLKNRTLNIKIRQNCFFKKIQILKKYIRQNIYALE